MEQDQTVEKANPIKNEVWEWIKALLIAAALVFFYTLAHFRPVHCGRAFDGTKLSYWGAPHRQ